MILTVHVKANARENRITSWMDDTTIKMSVTATPEKGRANEAVIRLLADTLHLPPSQVILRRGFQIPLKQFEIPDDINLAYFR